MVNVSCDIAAPLVESPLAPGGIRGEATAKIAQAGAIDPASSIGCTYQRHDGYGPAPGADSKPAFAGIDT